MSSIATHNRTKRILIALMVIAPVTFLSAIPWLRDGPEWITFLAAGMASFTLIAAAMAFAIIKDRQVDEWTRTGARFSGHWGMVVGGAAIALLLALPFFRDFITEILSHFHGAPVDKQLVLITFTAGFMACMMAQSIAVLILGFFWRMWMSRTD